MAGFTSNIIAGMTLEQRIGQLYMVGFHGTTASSDILDLIQRHAVGGVILFSRNASAPQQIQDLTTSLQAAAKAAGHRFPLLIATDQENGIVRRLGETVAQFPGNMALGAIGSEQVVQAIAEATGQELRALGVNMNLAPVADVNNNPANPVIGVRSFGEDPHQVARLVAASVRGYNAAGVIATLKHFPGHGDTATDSHLSLPVVPHTLQRLEQLELLPFQHGVAAGADAIMTAHLALPQITADATLPATLSAAVIQGLLRRRLGFTGVVVSDCLEMNAIAETVGVERGAVQALRAGVDLILVSHRADRQHAALEAVRHAIQTGALSADIIIAALERILRLKARTLSWDTLPSPAALGVIASPAHQRLRDDAYARSVTLARDANQQIPIHVEPSARLLVIARQTAATSRAVDLAYASDALVASVRRYHPNVSGHAIASGATDAERLALLQAVEAADTIILTTLNAYRDQSQAALIHELAPHARRLIAIAIGDPYDIAAFPSLPTYLATYEYTRAALDAAIDVLFGATQPQGRLPITLPDGIRP